MSETIFDEHAGTTHCCGKAWGGLRSLGARSISIFNTWRKSMDQNSLERALAQIIETANGHRGKGLPKGSPAYFVLRHKADAKIQAFARKWDVDIATIEAQAPALADLDSLCIPDRQVPAGLKLLAALLGTIFSLVLLGVASGLVHAGHDWVMRFVVR
ncbi:MAG: hypothetical protein WBM14_09555 [Terracidiphilus sp.]